MGVPASSARRRGLQRPNAGSRRGWHEGAEVRVTQPPPVSPELLRHLQERSARRENRVADQITGFAGSMRFVYLHCVWFGLWITLGVEDYPFGLLTMIVSLEAIFLSTFVMISQNRADDKRQVIANQQWQTVQDEEQQNQRLLRLSNEILDLTKEIYAASAPRQPASPLHTSEERGVRPPLNGGAET
jgi:uncharacterized membrane protein